MAIIYKITNKINDKIYIGSTKGFATRVRNHRNRLNRNVHPNPKLQNSWNKYGENNFKFEIIESNVPDQYSTEQTYLDKLILNKDKCFNLTFEAKAGGGDTQRIESFVLDLRNNIISKHKSIKDAFSSINSKSYANLNSKAITTKQYRIVTKKFYYNNLKEILSWKNSLNVKNKPLTRKQRERLNKRLILARDKIVLATIDDIEYEFKDAEEAAKYTGISGTLIRNILQNKRTKNEYNFRYIIDDINYYHRNYEEINLETC